MYQGRNYINGNFVDDPNSQQFLATNPSNNEIYGKFPCTKQDEVKAVVAHAREAQLKWCRESRVKRSDYFDTLAQLIKRDHESLRKTISIETGKNMNESHAEVIEALHMCQYVASMGRLPYGEVYGSELATKDAYVIRKPRGVVAVISPWNFPLAIGSFWCAAPAILEGNTVVHKPSELTPVVNDMVAALYHEAGFPAGVFNLIHGDGTTGRDLVKSDVDVILFTGSAEVAKEIKLHCASHPTKTCSVEAGSKSCVIVFPDANWELTNEVCMASAFKLSGQRCVSSGRFLVQENAVSWFKNRFLKSLKEELSVGDPFGEQLFGKADAAVHYGPLISDEHLRRVASYNQMVRDDSEPVILYDPDGVEGMLKDTLMWNGNFLRPFVYECEWGNKRYLKEEVFGPHVAIVPFRDMDEAIEIYNDTDYGLSLGILSEDFRVHREMISRCTAGMIYINGGSIAAESHLPFSSWKKSGYGSSAAGTWRAVTHPVSVTVNYEKGKMSWAQGMK